MEPYGYFNEADNLQRQVPPRNSLLHDKDSYYSRFAQSYYKKIVSIIYHDYL